MECRGSPRLTGLVHGYLRGLMVLKREGWQVGQEARVSVYRQKGLQLRMKVKRRKRIALLRGRPPLTRIRVRAFIHYQMLTGGISHPHRHPP